MFDRQSGRHCDLKEELRPKMTIVFFADASTRISLTANEKEARTRMKLLVAL